MPRVHEGVERGVELASFLEWVKTVPRSQLENLVADAHWKGQLKDSELQRFHILSKYGVDMRDRPPLPERELVEQLERAIGAAEYVIGVCEDDVKTGEHPSPFKKSCPNGALAHCYAAMNFVGGARKVLAKWKGKRGKDAR
jgi:hypothetical protein